MRLLRQLLCFGVLTLLFTTAAQLSPASAQTLDSIGDEVDQTGFYSEKDVTDVVTQAIDRANDENIGFVWLDQEGGTDTQVVAVGILDRLGEIDSSLRTLIVLDNSGVWVESLDLDASGAADAATAEFARGAVAGGIDTVINSLGAGTSVGATTPTTQASETTASSGSGGVPWLWILLLGVAAFFAIRWFSGRRRTAAALERALSEDRTEIREQLKNNADYVIDLGAKIANADDDLRRMYEQAAQAYQDVSLGLDDASTAAEIDALDDKLDKAEWQFQVIEARLEGRTPPSEPDWDHPPPPTSQPAPGAKPTERPPPSGRQPVPPLGDRGRSDAPALGSDESIFTDRGQTTNRRAPQPRRRRRSGGMMGSMLKSGIGAMLLRMLLGGGLGAITGSRRTQQRSSSGGRSASSRRSGGDSGLGGGVLR